MTGTTIAEHDVVIKAVLFDAGGTLIHMDRRFFIQTLNENGVAVDFEAFVRADVVARREIGRLMRSDHPGTDSSRWRAYARKLMAELECEGDALERVRAAMRTRHEQGALWTFVEDGTIEVLDILKERGYAIGVISNADGRVATFLEKAGLGQYFDTIVDSGIFGIEKPDPRIFLHACELLAVNPEDCVYVGDVYEVDALGAQGAGLTPIILARVPEAHWTCEVIASLTQLPRLLRLRAQETA